MMKPEEIEKILEKLDFSQSSSMAEGLPLDLSPNMTIEEKGTKIAKFIDEMTKACSEESTSKTGAYRSEYSASLSHERFQGWDMIGYFKRGFNSTTKWKD